MKKKNRIVMWHI